MHAALPGLLVPFPTSGNEDNNDTTNTDSPTNTTQETFQIMGPPRVEIGSVKSFDLNRIKMIKICSEGSQLIEPDKISWSMKPGNYRGKVIGNTFYSDWIYSITFTVVRATYIEGSITKTWEILLKK